MVTTGGLSEKPRITLPVTRSLGIISRRHMPGGEQTGSHSDVNYSILSREHLNFTFP